MNLVKLFLMEESKILQLVSPYKKANTYIIDVGNSEVVIIDLGNYSISELVKWLKNNNKTLIGLILTHEHSDHTSGLPDMRAMSLINQSIIPAFLSSDIKDSITRNYQYIFDGHRDYSPFMSVKTIESTFTIGNTKINTFKHNHGSIDVQTYRINNFAYSTDLKNFYENDIDKLKDLDLWIVGLLRYDPHPSHAGFDQINEYINYLKPKRTLFTHMTALLDYDELMSKCSENVEPAYDGMTLEL